MDALKKFSKEGVAKQIAEKMGELRQADDAKATEMLLDLYETGFDDGKAASQMVLRAAIESLSRIIQAHIANDAGKVKQHLDDLVNKHVVFAQRPTESRH